MLSSFPRRAAAFALLSLCVSVAYLPAFKAGYTNWDDAVYTTDNPVSRAPWPHAAAAAFTSFRVGHYHPLTDISLAAEAAVLGERPAVRHSVSLLLHSLNAWLLFLLIEAVTGAPLPALAGALLWALHPVNAESAAWVAERKNLLYAFFYLGALLAYLRRLKNGSWRWTAAAGTLFLLSMLSKASAVTLPLAMLGLDWLYGRPLDRRNLVEKAIFFVAAAGFAAAAAAAQGGSGTLLPGALLKLFSFYLMKSAWPAALSALYPYMELGAWLNFHGTVLLLPAAAFAALLFLAVRKRKDAAFGLFFFLVNILPFALVIPIGPAMAADRYLYMPLAGLALAAAAAVASLGRREGRTAALAALFALSLPAALLARERALVWSSSERLWTDVLAKYPRAQVANLNMAEALLEKRDWEPAMVRLRLVLAENPHSQAALYDLGTTLAMTGRPAEGLPLLLDAVQLKPGYAPAWNNLGLTFLALGRRGEAVKAFSQALKADPSYSPATANLASAGARQRR